MSKRIAIIGGGIIGSVIASRLLDAEDPPELTLIDANQVGMGASLYSAGVHFPVGRSERARQLAAQSAQYYAALREVDPSLPIYPFDMWVAGSVEQTAEIESRCAGLASFVQGDVPDDLGDIERSLVLGKLPGCHVSDVQRVTQWHIARLRGRAAVLEGIRATALDESPERVRVSLSNGHSIEAEILIIAPGPWTNDAIFKPLISTLGIRIKKIVAIHVDRPLNFGSALYFPFEDAFLAPLPHRGHWLFSYTCPQWDVSPLEMRNASLESREIDEARSVVSNVMPRLVPSLSSGRVFCDAYSPEREPVTCRVGTSGRIVFAGAGNGSGYRLAPGIANEIKKLLGRTDLR